MQTFNIFGPPKAYLWECLSPLSSNFQERTKVIDITWDVLFLSTPPPPFWPVQTKAARGSAHQLSWGWVYLFKFHRQPFLSQRKAAHLLFHIMDNAIATQAPKAHHSPTPSSFHFPSNAITVFQGVTDSLANPTCDTTLLVGVGPPNHLQVQ